MIGGTWFGYLPNGFVKKIGFMGREIKTKREFSGNFDLKMNFVDEMDFGGGACGNVVESCSTPKQKTNRHNTTKSPHGV
jgi:hypothetical protein